MVSKGMKDLSRMLGNRQTTTAWKRDSAIPELSPRQRLEQRLEPYKTFQYVSSTYGMCASTADTECANREPLPTCTTIPAYHLA